MEGVTVTPALHGDRPLLAESCHRCADATEPIGAVRASTSWSFVTANERCRSRRTERSKPSSNEICVSEQSIDQSVVLAVSLVDRRSSSKHRQVQRIANKQRYSGAAADAQVTVDDKLVELLVRAQKLNDFICHRHVEHDAIRLDRVGVVECQAQHRSPVGVQRCVRVARGR